MRVKRIHVNSSLCKKKTRTDDHTDDEVSAAKVKAAFGLQARKAAVDPDILSGDPSCLLGYQQKHSIAHVFNRPVSISGPRFRQFRPHHLILQARWANVSCNGPRADRIDSYAAAAT